MPIINQELLDEISALAKASPRRRKNYNFHAAETDSCHRLLNAIEPGSYVQPHRHLDPGKDEAMVVVRGKLGAVLFSEEGEALERLVLAPGGEAVAVDIPHGTFHTVLALAPDTVFFEAKAGPYQPLAPAEKARWAPAEGAADAAAYLAVIAAMFN